MIDFAQYAPQKMFLLQGDQEVFDRTLEHFVKQYPLTQALSVPRFTIEHARSVAEFALEGTGEARVFVVFFSVFSPDAAQVLLKSLEEPDRQTTIVFITAYPYLVPKTVRSRVTLVSGQHIAVSSKSTRAKVIADIQKEAAEKEDDPATRRARAVLLLDVLESVVRTDSSDAKVVYEAKDMLFKANMPTKFVLDYVATVVRS